MFKNIYASQGLGSTLLVEDRKPLANYSGDGLKDDKQGEVYGEQYWLIIKANKSWV